MYIKFNIGPNEEYRVWSVSESFTYSVKKEVEINLLTAIGGEFTLRD
jgi:hypothetical protein